jgi:hypothetical protein
LTQHLGQLRGRADRRAIHRCHDVAGCKPARSAALPGSRRVTIAPLASP